MSSLLRLRNIRKLGAKTFGWRISTRYQQMILSFLGLTIYGAHSSANSVGIVAMTRPSDTSEFPILDYTIAQKGVLLTIFGYGYSLGNVVFGYLADVYGPMKISPIAGGLVSGQLFILYPISCVHGGYSFDCWSRFLQGFLMSSIFPSVYVHMSKWVVPEEQSKFSFIWAGEPFGRLIVSSAAGLLVATTAGWSAIYYFIGCLCLAWGLVCLIWGANTPGDHMTISAEEKTFIESRLPRSARKSKRYRTPWMEMFKSVPLWAFLIVQTADWFGSGMIYLFEPTYLSGVFNLSVEEAGYAVSCSYLAHIPVSFLITYIAMKTEGLMTTNFSRKMWNTIGNCGEAVMFFLLALLPEGATSSIVLFTISYSLGGAVHIGYMANVLDFAPNYAGTITGVLTTFSSLITDFSPMTAGMLLHDEADMNSWRTVFILGGVIYILGNAVFVFFGSTDLEPWNNFDGKEDEEEKLTP